MTSLPLPYNLQPVEEESAKLVIEIHSTKSACAGAAAAYVLRRIAAKAGAYAPGIQERMFFDLQRDFNGRNLDMVGKWFRTNQAELSRLGYRFYARRVAFRTEGVANWVAAGNGFRGAILPTSGHRLYPSLEQMEGQHAVALTVDAINGDGSLKQGLMMIDPYPGVPAAVAAPPPALDAAHRDNKYAALVVYWAGYS